MIKSSYNFFIIFASLLVVFQSYATNAAVFVSSEISLEHPPIKAMINQGQSHIEPVHVRGVGETLKIEGHIDGVIYQSIVVLICDHTNIEKYKAGTNFSCAGREYKKSFSFEYKIASNEPHYLVFRNDLELLKPFKIKKVSATVKSIYSVPREEKDYLESTLKNFQEAIFNIFDIPDFDIILRPCGQKNAYSDAHTGDIEICTEIYGDAILKKAAGLFAGVLFHEVAHTALNLWGLPGWDNERTADEFAAVMLIITANGNTNTAEGWVQFFNSDRNAAPGQAIGLASSGSNHPLDIQRINVIKEIIDDPLPTVKRWNKILYPQMKKEILEQIVSGEFNIYGRDVELAQKVLGEKFPQAN